MSIWVINEDLNKIIFMSRIKWVASVFPFWILSCCVKPSAKESWQISYEKVEYLFGSISIKIGTDSCYYQNQSGINKNPPIFKWKSKKKKLTALYNQVMSYHLQQGNPIMATVTEMPFETLELVQNGKVVFSLQKHHQSQEYEKKFDEVVVILKSFSFSENDGWKY